MAGKKGRAEAEELILRGSLYTFRRKCGNENCRCRRGELHESPALSFSVGGRTKLLVLREEDVPRVSEALRRYREASEALEAQAMRGAESLKAELEGRRAKGGRAR